jgi:hypothetical protein
MAITIKGNTKISSRTVVGRYGAAPVVSYVFNAFADGGVCSDTNDVVVYSSSAVLGIGSRLYTENGLTIPTTYSQISDPASPGGGYFILTGNIITSEAACN